MHDIEQLRDFLNLINDDHDGFALRMDAFQEPLRMRQILLL